MMTKLLFGIWLLLGCSLAQASGSGFIGNGGQGYRIGGKLYVRDLVEAGIHLTPYVGAAFHPQETPEALQLLFPFPIPAETLSRKLQDLARVRSDLPWYLHQVFAHYRWLLVDQQLEETTEADPDMIHLPEGSERVQIANRFQLSMRISRSAWRELNDEQRAALLLHEAFYSITRPVLLKGHATQRSYPAREITGHLFLVPSASPLDDQVWQTVLADLTVPTEPVDPEQLRVAPAFEMETLVTNAGNFPHTLRYTYVLRHTDPVVFRDQVLAQVCSGSNRSADQNSLASFQTVRYRAWRAPVQSAPVTYEVDDAGRRQTYINFVRTAGIEWSPELNFADVEECRTDLARAMQFLSL